MVAGPPRAGAHEVAEGSVDGDEAVGQFVRVLGLGGEDLGQPFVGILECLTERVAGSVECRTLVNCAHSSWSAGWPSIWRTAS